MKINKLYIVISIVASVMLASCVKEEMPADMEQVQSPVETPVEEDVAAEKAILKALLANRDTKWTVNDLDIPTLNGGCYEIKSANELAYLLEFGSTKGEKYRLVADVDVSKSSIAEKFSGEIGAEPFENFEFDGNGKTISGLDLPLAAGLFSRVKDSKISNLTLASSTVGSADNVSNLLGTGAVVGTASGTIEVSNVTVSSCNVYAPCKLGGFVGAITDGTATFTSCAVSATNVNGIYLKGISGWCGGFVGFVGRTKENDTVSSVKVTFTDCDINGGAVKPFQESDHRTCGQFLGMLVGFDSNVTLTMSACDVTTTYTGQDAKSQVNPHYKIGGHKYENGVILVDDRPYVNPWDGKTTKQPALTNGVYDVYTAEELAWFQGKTETTNKIHIHKDIDLAGQLFTPIYKANYIDGNNYEIRNLKVFKNDCGKTDGGAFIRQASGTTVHKNITFRNADIKATHDAAADHGNAYCATLCGNMTGKYTMENVHAYNGKLYGVNKMGGLLGRVYATATISNCSVNGYYIENYKVMDKPETFSGTAEKLGMTVTATATFHPHGEIGGMIGFIQGNTTVTDCHVKTTQINGVGQADQKAELSGDWAAVLAIKAAGGFTVPGRHVSTLIGDIRIGNSSSSFNITISGCSADAETESMISSWDKHASNAQFIGQCYYVYSADKSEGSVTVDGSSMSINHCVSW